jgi:chromate reductase
MGWRGWKFRIRAIQIPRSGAIGTAVAQSQLRSLLPVVEMVVMGQPEVYFQFKPGLISDDLSVTDDQTRSFLELYLERFEVWIDRVGSKA